MDKFIKYIRESRNLLLYMSGRFISLIGTGIQMVALPLYILDLTHSGMMMGIFSMLNLVPNLLASPFAGILGDRKNRKNIMIITDFGRGFLICFLGILSMTGTLNIYILFVCQIFISVMDSIFGSSSGALLPELLSEDRLMKAMSLRGGFDAASMIVGPVLGGILYGLLGIKAVFYINGISFFISGICSLFIIYVSKIKEKGKIVLKNFYSENREILVFIKQSRGLMQLFVYAMFTNFLMAPLFDIVMPYVLKQGIGFTSQQYGYLMGFFTVGILLGNVLLGAYLHKFRTKHIMKSGFLFETFITLLFTAAIFPEIVSAFGGHSWKLFWIIGACIVLIGGFNALVNTPLSTNLQKMVPNEMRSRFFSLVGMFSQGAIPLGSLLYGFLLDKFPYYYITLTVVLLTSVTTVAFVAMAVPEVYEPAAAV